MAAEGMAAGRLHSLSNRGQEQALFGDRAIDGSMVQVAQHELLSCCTTLLGFRTTKIGSREG